MNVTVIFPKNSQPDIAKAIIAERICQAASLYIDLPDNIRIEFCDLEHYGETVLISKKIKLNITLTTHEIIFPLIHELIHLNQMHKGRLVITRFGDYVWEGKTFKVSNAKLTHKEYKQLPWEVDVTNREKELLVKVLK